MQHPKRKFPHNRAEVDRALRARWQIGAEGATNKHRATERTIHLQQTLRQKLTTAMDAAIEGLR